MVVTESGILMLVRPEQPEKAPPAIDVIQSGIILFFASVDYRISVLFDKAVVFASVDRVVNINNNGFNIVFAISEYSSTDI